MAKKMAFIGLLGFLVVTMVMAQSNSQIYNSWIGHHYTETFGKFDGKMNQTTNTITYDSSWTEDIRVWKASGFNVFTGQGMGEYGWVKVGERTHEQWVVFHFDENGIITSWRSNDSNSTDVSNYPKNTQRIWFTPYPGSKTSGIFVGYISSFDSTSEFDFARKYGFTFGMNDYVPAKNAWVGSIDLDYLVNNIKPESQNSLLIGATIGYQMFSMFVVYAGGGVGYTFESEGFAWKVNGGLRLQFGDFFVKFDVANMSPFGLSFGAGIGLFFL
jgi:hypothetical protein